MFLNAQQINITDKLTESSFVRRSLTPQTDKVSPPPKFVGLIRSSFIRNPDKTSTVVATQISSFTSTIQNHLVNEVDEGTLSLEGNNQEALDAEIDNLMEYEEIDNPIELQP